MASTQKPESMAQTMQLRPILQDDGLSSVKPPGEAYTIDDWIQDHPEHFPDVDEGIVKEMMTIALHYVEQLKLVAVKHQGGVLVLEEFQHKMRLLIDGDSELDRRLAEAPKEKESIVSTLIRLVLVLNTGISLVTPENRQSLREDTYQVVEQASKIVSVHLPNSDRNLPHQVLEFLDATKSEIMLRIDKVSDLILASDHLVPSFDKEPSPQVEETAPDGRRPFGPDKSSNGARPQAKRSRANLTSVGGSSRTAQDAENSGRAYSDPSKSSSKHSSRSSKTPSIFSDFSDDGSHSHTRPSTNTATSMLLSETKTSFSETATSTSSRPSTICKNCNALLNEHEEKYESRVLGRQITQIEMKMSVKIRHRESKRLVDRTMLIDTGCDLNFISPSLVKELGLDVSRLTTPIDSKGFAKNKFQVNEAVIPEWRFSEGSTMHQEFTFYILPHLPGGIDVTMGNKARSDMGTHLCKVGILVAIADSEDVPAQEQSKLKRSKRDHRNKTEIIVKPRVSGGQPRQVEVERLVSIKHQTSQGHRKKLMLTDTGSHENLIRRSVVDELGLTIVPSDRMSLTGLDGYKVESQGYVVPDWYFLDKSKPNTHPGIAFQVIEKIPNSVDILLGRNSGSVLGIDLYEKSVCVAHQHLEDTVAQEQRKQQRIRQDRDTTEAENQLRQAFEARHAKLIEQREAESKAPDHTKREISTSQRDVCGSRDVRR